MVKKTKNKRMKREKEKLTRRKSARIIKKRANTTKNPQLRASALRTLRLIKLTNVRESQMISRRLNTEVARIEQIVKGVINAEASNPATAIALQTFSNADSWLYFTPENFKYKIVEILTKTGMGGAAAEVAAADYRVVHRATGALFHRVCLTKIQEMRKIGLTGRKVSASAKKKFKKRITSVIKKLTKKKRLIQDAFANFEQSTIINDDELLNSTIHQYSKWIGNIFGYTPDSFRKSWLNKVQDKAQCAKMIQHRQRGQSGETKTPSAKVALETYYNNQKCYICSGHFREWAGAPFIDDKTPECEHILPIFLALRHLWIVRKNDISEYDEEQLNVLDKEYEFSHRCCNQCKSDLSFIKFYTDTVTRRNQCRIDFGNIDEMFRRILRHSQTPSWGCDVIMSKFLDRANKIQVAKRNLSQRLQIIVGKINGFINNQEFGFGGNVVEYLAWTKLKALTCLSNWELFELFTEEAISESILNRIPGLSGGSKSDNSIETNKLFLLAEKILHSPVITDKEIIFNTLLNYGSNIEGQIFEPPEINYNDNGTSTVKMVLNGKKIVQTVESLDAVQNNFLKPIDFTLYRSEEAPEIPSIYEDIDTENGNNTLQVFFSILIDMVDINTVQTAPPVQTVSPEVIPTNITSEQEKFNSDIATIIGSFMRTGMSIKNAQEQTIKSIRDMQNITKRFTGQEESVMSAASKIVRETGRPTMITGRPLSVIPESIGPISMSVQGGKRKKTKKHKKKKRKKKTKRKRKNKRKK